MAAALSNVALGVLDITAVDRGLLIGQDNSRVNFIQMGRSAFFGNVDPSHYTGAATFDLALEKTIADSRDTSNLQVGDDVTYTIEVFNQGTVDATDLNQTTRARQSDITCSAIG